MVITYTFPGCWLFVDEPGTFLHTAFPDGAKLESVVNEKKDGKTAERYGYGDDVRALWREHDLLHHAVGTLFGIGYSPTIWAVAHPDDPRALERWQQRDEERFIGFIHRWLNLDEWHFELGVLETLGRTRDELKEELQALLHGDITTFGVEPNLRREREFERGLRWRFGVPIRFELLKPKCRGESCIRSLAPLPLPR